MDKFSSFITEAKDKPYKLVVLSHDDSYDPNLTGVLIRDKAKKLKIESVLFEFVGLHLHEVDNKLFINSFYLFCIIWFKLI